MAMKQESPIGFLRQGIDIMYGGPWFRSSFKDALVTGAIVSIFIFIYLLAKSEPLGIAVKALIGSFFFLTLFLYAPINILWFICSRIAPKRMKYLFFEDLYDRRKR
ncbi:MAG: hypothetical protein AB8E87_09480 [Prochlorococcus sp.]